MFGLGHKLYPGHAMAGMMARQKSGADLNTDKEMWLWDIRTGKQRPWHKQAAAERQKIQSLTWESHYRR